MKRYITASLLAATISAGFNDDMQYGEQFMKEKYGVDLKTRKTGELEYKQDRKAMHGSFPYSPAALEVMRQTSATA